MAYWDMEANGNDSGPRGNNQTGFGTPTFVAGGKPNNRTNLVAASSQYFEMANNGDIVLSATNFTLAAWANLATTGGLRRIFGKGNISTRRRLSTRFISITARPVGLRFLWEME